MTRKELLHLLVMQARVNGFELRKWYQSKIDRQLDQPRCGNANAGRRAALLCPALFA